MNNKEILPMNEIKLDHHKRSNQIRFSGDELFENNEALFIDSSKYASSEMSTNICKSESLSNVSRNISENNYSERQRKPRFHFSHDQLNTLEKSFENKKYLTSLEW